MNSFYGHWMACHFHCSGFTAYEIGVFHFAGVVVVKENDGKEKMIWLFAYAFTHHFPNMAIYGFVLLSRIINCVCTGVFYLNPEVVSIYSIIMCTACKDTVEKTWPSNTITNNEISWPIRYCIRRLIRYFDEYPGKCQDWTWTDLIWFNWWLFFRILDWNWIEIGSNDVSDIHESRANDIVRNYVSTKLWSITKSCWIKAKQQLWELTF